jgi:hypothetical protein
MWGAQLAMRADREVIKGHQGSSMVINGHQWSSIAIKGHQGSSRLTMRADREVTDQSVVAIGRVA